MSAVLEPIDAAENIAPVSHRRILWLMGAVVVVGVGASLIFSTLDVTLGLFIGGLLSFLNYYWLKVSLRNFFDKLVSNEGNAPLLGLKYFLRYVALGAVAAAIYFTGIASITALVAGMSAFVAAVMIEAVLLLFGIRARSQNNLRIRGGFFSSR
jgi:ATP synthase I chain